MNTDIDPLEEAFRSAFDVIVEPTVDAATWQELTARVDTGTSPDATRRGNRVLAAVAAAAFVLVFIGGAALLFGLGTESVAPTATMPSATTLADIDQPAKPVTTMAPAEESTATTGFTCPPGSTPNQPGPSDRPRPEVAAEDFAPVSFASGSGRMLLFTGESLWMFDVCTNTWTEGRGVGEDMDIAWPLELVYDIDSDRLITLGRVHDKDEDEDVLVWDVWAYEPATQTWTRKSDRELGPNQDWGWAPEPEFKAVYDPVTGLVLVRETLNSELWTYDVDTDTWTEVDQGATRPPAIEESGFHTEVLTYDASVDRLILYVAGGVESELRGTWEFDMRAGRWEEHETNIHPVPGFSWPTSDAFVYDEANQVSVLFSEDTLATYDASGHRWTILQRGDPAGDKIRSGATMTYDPVNQRMLVTGITGDGVFAFDVATGESITLLEHTPWPWKGWFVIGGVFALTIGVLLAAFAAYSRRWQDGVRPS